MFTGTSATVLRESVHASQNPDDLGFLELSSDLVCICRDDCISAINGAGVRILQAADATELLGRKFHDFLAADYAEAVDDGLVALIDEAQPFPLKLIGVDGTEIGAQVSVYLAGEADAGAVIVFARDVTHQVELSEAIHRSEQRYRNLVSHSMNLFCVCEDGRIGYINRAGQQMLGAPDTEALAGLEITAILHPDYREVVAAGLAELAREDATMPMKLVRLDGRVLDVEVNLTALDGRVGSQFMFEARDLTDHNRHVAALRQSIETLEQRVEERTRALREEVTERRKAEETMRHMASHDGLTGLPNRYLLKDRLAQALDRARRAGSKAALLFVDLDGFKPINDHLGHDAGDLLLKGVAERLRRTVRRSDTIARLGGDEFVMVLGDLHDTAEAVHVADKLLAALAEPFDLDGAEGRVGASIGIALFPDHGDGPESLQKAADAAMYAAKDAGKNTWRLPADGD